MAVSPLWRSLGRLLAGLAGCAALGWFAFVAGTRVPLLAMFDLGIHELGHMLAMPLPQLITVAAGSGLQVAVPAGLAAYFFARRRDVVAGSLMLAWTGTSLQDVSVYAADAPYQALPLIYPNAIHDWAWLLGPQGFDAMASAATVAHAIELAGLVTLLAGVGVLILTAAREMRAAEDQADRRSFLGPVADRPRPVRPVRRHARPPRSIPSHPHPPSHPIPERLP